MGLFLCPNVGLAGERYGVDKRKLGLLEGYLSSGVNIALFGAKIWVGLAVGSIAMVADGWHTLSDTMTSIVVIVGIWLGGRSKDFNHPFGHGRAELIGAVIIGTLLLVVGANFLKESVLRLSGAQTAKFSSISLAVFAASAVIKEVMAQFSIWAGHKTESKSLIADGWHHRSDAIASGLIVAGALLGTRIMWIDGALGIAVSALLFWAAIEIIRSTATTLLGESADAETVERIHKIINATAPDAGPTHHIHIHRYGDHVEATLHVTLPADYTLDEAHRIADRIDMELRRHLALEPTIHLEPENSDKVDG